MRYSIATVCLSGTLETKIAAISKAQFDLSTKEIQRLKQLRVLYDEDTFFVFFQIFTRLIYETFYFEIVQRNGYRSYGFPHAQLQLTMQAADIDHQNV